METRPPDVIVIGASAGGIPALKEVLAGLPEGLPAAILAVPHVDPSAALEVLVPQERGHRFELLGRGAAVPAPRRRVVDHVGRVAPDAVLERLLPELLRRHHRDRVRVLAGGAARGPRADRRGCRLIEGDLRNDLP